MEYDSDVFFLTESFQEFDLDLPSSSDRTEKPLLKSEKKLARYTRIVERRKEKRKREHKARKAKLKISGKTTIICDTVQICIDLAYSNYMSSKELSKLARQIGRTWGLQKLYEGVEITLVSQTEVFGDIARRVVAGFDSFGWRNVERLEDATQGRRLVYLSPDSELQPLMELNPLETYVIGGLVDETGKGSLSREKAGYADYKPSS